MQPSSPTPSALRAFQLDDPDRVSVEVRSNGLTSLHDSISEILSRSLRHATRGDCLRLVLAVPLPLADPHVHSLYQIDGKLDAMISGRINLRDVVQAIPLDRTGSHFFGRIERVQAEGNLLDSRTPATYNPLVTLWDRALDAPPRDALSCLTSLAGRSLRVQFVFDGALCAVQGALRTQRSERGGFIFDPLPVASASTTPQTIPGSVTSSDLRTIELVQVPQRWEQQVSTTVGMESFEDTLNLRALFIEGSPVALKPKDGPVVTGRFWGIDDRYLPVVCIRTDAPAQSSPTPLLYVLPLRDVASIVSLAPLNTGSALGVKALYSVDEGINGSAP